MNARTVYACEAQPIALEGLEAVLSRWPEFQFVGSANSPEDAVRPIAEIRPDVVLIDQTAGLKAVFQLISAIKRDSPGSQPVLWVQELAEVECFRALQIGARGILKKTLPVTSLVECLRTVTNGNIWIENSISNQVVGFLNRRQSPRLTPREREIVQFVCRGMKNKQIAEALHITAGTVKVHLMHIFEKTGAKDRFELAVHGRKLVEPDLEPPPPETALTSNG